MVYGRDRAVTRDNYKDGEHGVVVEAGETWQGLLVLSPLRASSSLRGMANICLSNICSCELSCSPLKSQMPSPFLT